jgi:hypothetical protein
MMFLRERFGTQFNNCSVPDRSLDFLPLSLPDMVPTDTHSSDIFSFPRSDARTKTKVCSTHPEKVM